MNFMKSMLLPILGYLTFTVGAESGAKVLLKNYKPITDEAKLENLIYQSMQSIVSLDELVTTLSAQVAQLTTSLSGIKADVKKIGDLQSSLTETKKDVGDIKTVIAEKDKDLGNVKREIQNLKSLGAEIKGKVDNMGKEVAVISSEQSGGNQQCAKVCAGTTGRTTSKWINYSGSGIYMDVDISRCGFARVPTITSSIEGSSSHWMATGTASIYHASPTKFRIYLSSNVRGRAKTYKWNVEWIAVGHTC